jgi:hypothetical protein
MLAVVGTVPVEDFPLVAGQVRLDHQAITIEGLRIPVNRGTPALVAAAAKTMETFGHSSPFVYVVGDIGVGHGSRRLYTYLAENLIQGGHRTLVFHYLQPDVEWQARILSSLDSVDPRPTLIADAGFMYGAKMSGLARAYDLFTPDIGELAFLADEAAPHPFYTRGFILHEENRVGDLIGRAYAHNNAARYLLVKGQQDYLADGDGVIETIDQFPQEAMEAIGGTGDTLTGIVAALIGSGMNIEHAASLAARVNRLAGHLARPTPATQVMDIVDHIPTALSHILEDTNTHEPWEVANAQKQNSL